MNEDEVYSFEDRIYTSPTVSRDEQLAFIDNLRSAQNQANQEIETQTRNLGTQVPLNQGGLTSGATDANSYFMSRYQTPQVDSQVANLRQAAQLSALNQLLQNQESQWSQRYNTAYSDLQKRRYDLKQRQYDLDARQYEQSKRSYEQSKRHYLENKQAQQDYYNSLKSDLTPTNYTTKGEVQDEPAEDNSNGAGGQDDTAPVTVEQDGTPTLYGRPYTITAIPAENKVVIYDTGNNQLIYSTDWDLSQGFSPEQFASGGLDVAKLTDYGFNLMNAYGMEYGERRGPFGIEY